MGLVDAARRYLRRDGPEPDPEPWENCAHTFETERGWSWLGEPFEHHGYLVFPEVAEVVEQCVHCGAPGINGDLHPRVGSPYWSPNGRREVTEGYYAIPAEYAIDPDVDLLEELADDEDAEVEPGRIVVNKSEQEQPDE